MNINLLHEKLIRAARSNPPSDRVPYAFEKRILARIRSEKVFDSVTLWARALWRAAIPCVALMLLLSIWATVTPQQSTSASTDDLGAELQTTLMASVSVDNEFSW
jgi:hypothetical protein